MQVAAMSCTACNVKVEGPYIKALEENTNMGYAAIRTRLDKLISNTKTVIRAEDQKKAILEKLRSGDITVAEAKRKLGKL
jgi:hypothetical protein